MKILIMLLVLFLMSSCTLYDGGVNFCENTHPKYKYLQKVLIVGGFYRGQVGVIYKYQKFFYSKDCKNEEYTVYLKSDSLVVLESKDIMELK
jgi:hypothetical protein